MSAPWDQARGSCGGFDLPASVHALPLQFCTPAVDKQDPSPTFEAEVLARKNRANRRVTRRCLHKRPRQQAAPTSVRRSRMMVLATSWSPWRWNSAGTNALEPKRLHLYGRAPPTAPNVGIIDDHSPTPTKPVGVGHQCKPARPKPNIPQRACPRPMDACITTMLTPPFSFRSSLWPVQLCGAQRRGGGVLIWVAVKKFQPS